MRRRDLAAALGGLLALGPKAIAAPPEAPRAVSDADIREMIAFRVDRQRRATGIVVGVIRPAGRIIVAHGATTAGGDTKVDGDTVFAIASLTKVFTSLLLADAAARGELRVGDPLARHLPPSVRTPTFQGRQISLEDLASHGSGLPLRPPNLVVRDERNPYAGYTRAQMYDGLSRFALTGPPGAAFGYSNLAYGLLGDAVARTAGVPYDELLRRRLTGPLRMDDTALIPTVRMRGRLAQGYDRDLKPTPNWEFGALAPAGGLYSTADDLMTFLEVFLGRRRSTLAGAAATMLETNRPADRPDTRMGLGWRRSRVNGETVVWSNGNVDGFRSFMGFNPGSGVAVVALANAGSAGGVDDIGFRVLDPQAKVDMRIPVVRTAVVLPPEALERFVGDYRLTADDSFAITREGDRLFYVGGPNRIELFAESPSRLFMKLADIQLDFGSSDGRPDSVVFHQDGEQWTYRRVELSRR